jgi:hypothetical protein
VKTGKNKPKTNKVIFYYPKKNQKNLNFQIKKYGFYKAKITLIFNQIID